MHTFPDADGRKWNLRITIGGAERLKSALGVDLLNLEEGEPPMSARLATDHPLRFHALFILLEREAQVHQVDDAAFCAALDGTAVAAATNAFWKELLDFFRGLDRLDLVKLVEAQKTVIETGVAHNGRKVDQNLSKALTKLFPAETPSTEIPTGPSISGSTSGDSPGSAESTPAPSAFAS